MGLGAASSSLIWWMARYWLLNDPSVWAERAISLFEWWESLSETRSTDPPGVNRVSQASTEMRKPGKVISTCLELTGLVTYRHSVHLIPRSQIEPFTPSLCSLTILVDSFKFPPLAIDGHPWLPWIGWRFLLEKRKWNELKMKDPKPELGTLELNGNDRLEGNTGLIS